MGVGSLQRISPLLLSLLVLAAGCDSGDGGDADGAVGEGGSGASGETGTDGVGGDTTGASTVSSGGDATGTDEGTTSGGDDDGTGDGDGDGDGDGEPSGAPAGSLPLPPGTSPIDVPEGTVFSADVSCGEFEANAFDVFLPESDAPTPLVIYVHGGGFTGGDKRSAYEASRAPEVAAMLEGGLAFATINYRTLEEGDDVGVIKALGDSRRCLQFLRYHAASLNVDPTRVGLYGGSAGAGTSLWLATHDEMRDLSASDPVERMSTRVAAVGASGTQATYDLLRWLDPVFVSYALTLDDVLALGLGETMSAFYGIDDLGQLETPEIQASRAEVDMLAMWDATDPPLWIQTNGADVYPDTVGILYHHPNHADEVRRAAEAAGVSVTAEIPNLGITDPSHPSISAFMIEQLRP